MKREKGWGKDMKEIENGGTKVSHKIFYIFKIPVKRYQAL